jgi:hypothetical protein
MTRLSRMFHVKQCVWTVQNVIDSKDEMTFKVLLSHGSNVSWWDLIE